MLRLMGVRGSDVSANPLVVFVKDHAVAIVKRDPYLLPWTEMNVAGQQNFDVIVAVALAEQIGVVTQSLHDFTLKLNYGTDIHIS